METNFKIAKFVRNDNSFEKTGYDEYSITYLKGVKVHELRVVVNGYLTKQTINIIDFSSGYKNKILVGIKEYLENVKSNFGSFFRKIENRSFDKNYNKIRKSPLVLKVK